MSKPKAVYICKAEGEKDPSTKETQIIWTHLDKYASLQKAVLLVQYWYLQKQDSAQHQLNKCLTLPLYSFHQFNIKAGFIPGFHPDLGLVETFITVEDAELSSDKIFLPLRV